MGNREIAQHLNLNEQHTVKNYLFRIFEKLGLSNRVELVIYAIARLNQPRPQPTRSSKPSILAGRRSPLSTGGTWDRV